MMADPKSTDPYDHSPEHILNIMDFRNPTLADLRINERFPSESSSPQFNDPFLWDEDDYSNPNNCEAGTSKFPNEGEGTEDDSVPISVWPPEPVPFLCTCCQVLREIIHTNDMEIRKLEIHGRPGIICHGILDIYSPSLDYAGHEYRMFDLCKKSMDGVKQFLRKYCLERKQEGFWMIPDPLLPFFQALCVGLFCDIETHNVADDPPPHPSNPNADKTLAKDKMVAYAGDEEVGASSSIKTSLAAQRERTGRLTIKDVSYYFHLPIEEAAKRMRLCPTVVKKICRRDGLHRWPYRKIKAIERQLASWTVTSQTSIDPYEVTRAQLEIQRLQQKLDKIRDTSFI